MEYTQLRPQDIEVATRYGISRTELPAYREVSEQSGLSFATVCRTGLSHAVRVIEARRGPRVDVRDRIRDLRRRKHPELEAEPEPTGPFHRHVPVRS